MCISTASENIGEVLLSKASFPKLEPEGARVRSYWTNITNFIYVNVEQSVN